MICNNVEDNEATQHAEVGERIFTFSACLICLHMQTKILWSVRRSAVLETERKFNFISLCTAFAIWIIGTRNG